MYSIRTTPGFIIGSRPFGEAGKILSIFTRDLGLVTASAQGIRLEKSKLRYHVREFAFGSFSLVRGKELWRLTSAQESITCPAGRCLSSSEQQLLVRVASLLKRFLHGEEEQKELFEIVDWCRNFMSSSELNAEQFRMLESVTVFRILDSLGYIGNDPKLDPRLKSVESSLRLLDELAPVRTVINDHINKALRESQL